MCVSIGLAQFTGTTMYLGKKRHPVFGDIFVLPALDCHTGAVPALNEEVAVDHWLIMGSDDLPVRVSSFISYRDDMPFQVCLQQPSRVVGRYFGGKMRNGDFAIRYEDVLRGKVDHIQRIQPALDQSR